MSAVLYDPITRKMILLTAALLLDWLFGDPHGLWHPVQGIGALVTRLERALRRIFPAASCMQMAAGGCMVVCVLCCVAIIVAGVTAFFYHVHFFAGFLAELYWYTSALAARSLHRESRNVRLALERDGLSAGRTAVSMIVGRDTKALDEAGVVRAAVETVAENTSDGVVAPMLYLAVGGCVGGWLYKAVNTMDSMVGYKNEAYLYFGRAAAKLDDAVNFVPARLSAWFLLAACVLFRMHPRRAHTIYRRDRRKHASPNAAHTEAVVAGALGVRLAGDAVYFGKTVKKAFIGDASRQIGREDIRLAARLMYGAQAAAYVFCMGMLFLEAGCVVI